MTFDLINIQRNSIPSLTQVWFQSDFNFSKETQMTKTNILHLTWPQMTHGVVLYGEDTYRKKVVFHMSALKPEA